MRDEYDPSISQLPSLVCACAGILKDGDVKFETGDIVKFVLDQKYFENSTKEEIFCDYKNLPKVCRCAVHIFFLNPSVACFGAALVA